jgi:hypothetical protein
VRGSIDLKRPRKKPQVARTCGLGLVTGVETALASLRVSQEIRGHLLSHGVTGVQAASYDGHDYAPQKLEALETLHRFLTETSASVVHIAPRVVA